MKVSDVVDLVHSRYTSIIDRDETLWGRLLVISHMLETLAITVRVENRLDPYGDPDTLNELSRVVMEIIVANNLSNNSVDPITNIFDQLSGG